MFSSTTTHLVLKLSHLCLVNNKHLVTAESCTGGGVAFACTALSGSSKWFNGSFVTYTNEMKMQQLGVSCEILNAHGAVSEATVTAMVQGSLRASQANLSLAISGIAGPDGATETKPVGTVCLAYGDLQKVRHVTHIFDGDRDQVREQAMNTGLQLLIDFLSQRDI